MTPNLVPPNLLAQSAALNQVMWNGAGVVGPALGGIVVGQFGLAWAYGIDVVTYVVAVGFALLLRPQRPRRDGPVDEDDRGWAAVRNGLRYLKGKRVAAIDVHRRHRRHGVRDATRAVPGARRQAIPSGTRDGGLAVQRRRGGRPDRRVELGLGRQGPATRPCDPARGPGLGCGDHRLRPERRPPVARARVPRGRGKRRRDLRRLPLDRAAARRSRRAARSAVRVQHLHRGRRTAPRRSRGRTRRERVHAHRLGRVGRLVVPRGRRGDRGDGSTLRATGVSAIRPD